MNRPARGRLKEVLCGGAYLDEEHVTALLRTQQETGISLYELLRAHEGLSAEDRAAVFCALFEHLAYLDVSRYRAPAPLLGLVPRSLCEEARLFPISQAGGTLTVAMANPSDLAALDEVSRQTRCEVLVVVATEREIAAAIELNFGKLEEEEQARAKQSRHAASKDEMKLALEQAKNRSGQTRSGKAEEEESVVRLVELVLNTAIGRGASDIHLEPYEKEFRLRYRQDGKLIPVIAGEKNAYLPLVSRLKIMANLDIAEHRVPQDGRLKVTYQERDIDFRVSVLPTVHGEKVVLRILDKEGLKLDFTVLGFEAQARDMFIEAIAKPNGICLVTGPTGSGKSTTLYSALNNLNKEDTNIITLEDPVEYNIHGINQVQCNAKVGLTFGSGLRSILRQDPNVIMIGEIRDQETADIAIKAALTGHLVLSTLHTNDAPGAVSRLLDMGVEPFLLSASLNLCQAQRLVRKICEKCKKPVKVPRELLERYRDSLPQDLLNLSRTYRGEGCKNCNGTGYRGRTCVVEMMPVTPELKDMIARHATIAEIKQKAKEEGMISLLENGLRKAFTGVTTLEEVLRVTST